MTEYAIVADELSKKYCRSLKRSMLYGMVDISRNILGISSGPDILRKDEFWALDRVSLKIAEGETYGLIGPNGSGKTTFLKLINGIFWPDKGSATVYGRIGSLIQVGAGFHPMLTGGENIFVNGAILGMSRGEIKSKFKDIIDFAELDDFIDTPVKYYSSGMFVRLGFSIAVHAKPDILLVDEILSVGDINFQRKCMRKIAELKEQGVTIVLISHNLYMVEGLCDRAMCLVNGNTFAEGETVDVIKQYRDHMNRQREDPAYTGVDPINTSGDVMITDVTITDENGDIKNTFYAADKARITVKYNAVKTITDPNISIGIVRSDGLRCFVEKSRTHGFSLGTLNGEGSFNVTINKLQLLPGKYMFYFIFWDSSNSFAFARRQEDAITINAGGPGNPYESVFHPDIEWRKENA